MVLTHVVVIMFVGNNKSGNDIDTIQNRLISQKLE